MEGKVVAAAGWCLVNCLPSILRTVRYVVMVPRGSRMYSHLSVAFMTEMIWFLTSNGTLRY